MITISTHSPFYANKALRNVLDAHLPALCAAEGLGADTIVAAIEAGSMVLLGNPVHKGLAPALVGQPAQIKVNANLGTSPLSHCPESEAIKLRVALEAGADTVMDLSIAGDLDSLRLAMLAQCPRPVGTVPMYAVGQKLLDNDKDVASMDPESLFEEIALQAQQGVDFMTLHCGLSRRGAALGDSSMNCGSGKAAQGISGGRAMGIVSRGGAMLARWMLENERENPLLEYFDRVLELALAYNITLSLGDGLRPGAGCDAGDAAQWDEVIHLGQLALRARQAGVQCMVEGPGHVPMHLVDGHIRAIKKLTHNAPLYVLGPLVVDAAPGYDHVAGAIGAALAVQAGVDFLCYLTPAEHLSLPNAEDVRAGVMASRVAGHAGETALGTARALAREKAMNEARRTLDWAAMADAALDTKVLHEKRQAHAHEEVCAMCGKFCAVKMLRDRNKDN